MGVRFRERVPRIAERSGYTLSRYNSKNVFNRRKKVARYSVSLAA